MTKRLGMIKRRRYLIKNIFQFKFASVIVFGILMTVALVVWDVYSSIGTLVMEKGMDPYLLAFVHSFNGLLLKKLPLIIIFIVILSIFISHEISGPVYHLEKSMQQIKHGDFTEVVHLRKGDELKELAVAFNEMTEGLRNLVSKDKVKIEEISASLDKVIAQFKKNTLTPEEISEIKLEIYKINAKVRTLTSHIKI